MSGARTLQRRARADGSHGKNPVHKASLPSGGEWEKAWMAQPGRDELSRLPRVMLAHRNRLYRRHRAARRRGEASAAPPTVLHLKILDALIGMAAGGARLLEVSYGELAQRAGCCFTAAYDAVARLVAFGMLARQRRCVRPGGGGPPGAPAWTQDVNVYRIEIPAEVRAPLRRNAEQERYRRQVRHAAEARARLAAHAPPEPPPGQRAPERPIGKLAARRPAGADPELAALQEAIRRRQARDRS